MNPNPFCIALAIPHFVGYEPSVQPLEGLSAVLESHRQALEVVQTPGGNDASLVPVLGVDQDLVERLVQVDLAEDNTARDVVGEVQRWGRG